MQNGPDFFFFFGFKNFTDVEENRPRCQVGEGQRKTLLRLHYVWPPILNLCYMENHILQPKVFSHNKRKKTQ